jgi:hypothetical protein
MKNLTFDEILEMELDLHDGDLDAAANAEESQQVHKTVHNLFLIARDGTLPDLRRAMQKAFAPAIPSTKGK